MIIDFHTHVFPPQVKQKRGQYIDRDPCFALLYAKKEAKIATAEELIDSMDRAGIDISVIVNFGWMTHELCTETNDYILESIARFPKRLIGFCTVQPQSLDAAIAEIERCAQNGAKGIGELRPDIQLLDLEDEAIISPLMETVKKHRLILLTHASEPAGHDYPGKGIITPDVLYPFITHYPDVTIVCAHWGGGLPFYALMPEVQKALQNVYFDTAASPFLYQPQIYTLGSQLVGADKILFGSDYPLLLQTRLLQEIDSAALTEEEKSLILSGNAKRILNL
ncbi:MAG: amidohydrolase family protein [Chloroflexota bacterium]|nr:amidohydrolase family protein [Chloroflexota bacterium]